MSPVKVKVAQLTTLDGTVLRQDFREIWVSGISEVSGVVGDGEREQAVTEEEDMITLARGKGGVEMWIITLDPGRTQLPIQTQGATGVGQKTKDRFLGDFPIVKYSAGYRGCVAVVSAEFVLVAIGRRRSRPFSTCTRVSPCTTAPMKRVADSQLTKDSDDGDDGPEVID